MIAGDGSLPRVRILSDLHLGHDATQVHDVRLLEPLLEDLDLVVFNGDSCERTIDAWRPRAEDQMGELRALCARLGTEAVFLAGNHDPDISDAGWMSLREGAVFVSHGDLILPEVAPWSIELLLRRRRVRRILREFREPVSDLADLRRRARIVEDAIKPEVPPALGRGVWRYLVSALWPPGRPFAILQAWATMFGEAERFLDRYQPACRVFCFGHYHRPGVAERGGRLMCNTGSFMRGQGPLAVDLDADWIRARQIRTGPDGRFRAADPRAVFRLVDQLSRSM